jgi:hypothetical protein
LFLNNAQQVGCFLWEVIKNPNSKEKEEMRGKEKEFAGELQT